MICNKTSISSVLIHITDQSYLVVVAEIMDRGGVGKAVVCDHNDEDQTTELVATIEDEDGRLDLLVNNVYSGVPSFLADCNTPFWNIGTRKWDREMRVGLWSAYICTVLGTKLILRNNSGLIINIYMYAIYSDTTLWGKNGSIRKNGAGLS